MKILKVLFLVIYLCLFKFVFAVSTPVETVFSDINKSYKYYYELQDLYDKMAVYPDENGKFDPYKLLTRDEFVSISLEVSCKKCTRPNTEIEYINTYSDNDPFFDVEKTSKYFYCIALADDKNYVKWYDKDYTCENWVYKIWERPFCPANNITLEEALAVILRNSNLFTIWDNALVIQDIKDWKITWNLSSDVSPKNTDWSPYTFYWYLKKALDYSIEDYDNLWNKKVYKLLELQDWKIYPKKLVTKEDFLKMAYIALKSNSCKEDFNNNLAVNIWIFDKSCTSYDAKCNTISPDANETVYDFKAWYWWQCQEWVSDPDWYVWKFYNTDTWYEIIKTWKYIDNYNFLSKWNWKITLRITDKCNNIWESESSVFIEDNNNDDNSSDVWKGLTVWIDAIPIIWPKALRVDLKSIVIWWSWKYTYEWSLWNWDNDNWKDVRYIYREVWLYKVALHVVDSEWRNWNASVNIIVLDWVNTDTDSDDDWVPDYIDLCPVVIWTTLNNWCPILDNICWTNCSCPNWYVCNVKDWKLCSIKWVCLPDTDSLHDSISDCMQLHWLNNIFWNVSCNSCPCSNSLDFLSQLRKCDLLFPAITSPDSKKIYSKWEFYEIK